MKCNGGCGVELAYWGVCASCGDRLIWREHWISMAPVLESIPPVYQWARWGDDLFFERVPNIRPDHDIRKLLRSRILLLHGETGAGKTSLACALLRFLVEQSRPEESRVDLKLRQARFAEARAVAAPWTGEGPIPMMTAKRASMLVLDDVGQESIGDGFACEERCQQMANLLDHVYTTGIRAIITTYGPSAIWSKKYGAGIMRRFWEDEQVQVLSMDRIRRSS